MVDQEGFASTLEEDSNDVQIYFVLALGEFQNVQNSIETSLVTKGVDQVDVKI